MGFLKGAMTIMLKEWSKKKEFYARKPHGGKQSQNFVC